MEIWKSIKGYEEYYQVSSLGRVRAVERNEIMTWHGNAVRKFRQRICKQSLKDERYFVVGLSKNGIVLQRYVHRLIAEAFIGLIKNGMCVNHKDGNTLNNKIENLEIVTYRDNCLHGRTANSKNKTSRYPGVYFNKLRNKFIAMIRKKRGDKVYLGGYESEEEAFKKCCEYLAKENLKYLPPKIRS